MSKYQRRGLYTIGLDYGTLSGRAILADVGNGEVLAEATKNYTHGLMDRELPQGVRLPDDWAIQHPMDYVEVLETVIPQVVHESGVDPADIIGISVDFTGCTLVSLDKDGTPLCLLPEYKDDPLSWVLHWRHHGAASYADQVNEIVKEHDPGLLRRHGGRISAECMLPKVVQILKESPEVYAAADLFIEAGDWVTMLLTGEIIRSAAFAGYKGFWQEKKGFPDKAFYRAVDERLENFVETKLRGTVRSIGQRAGELTREMAARLGLRAGTSVAVSQLDGHASLPGAGIGEPAKLMMALGTSGAFILTYDKEVAVQGTTGMTENGNLPGLYGYASGLCAVGDLFAWFVNNMVPEAYTREAKAAGISVHQLLTEKAKKLVPGESGLLALDWWAGNRSILVNAQLSGMILGMTLQTKPEEIYRALLETTAFGMKRIADAYEQAGIHIQEVYAVGGIPKKNPLMMQIYADVLEMHINITKTNQAAALGSAMYAAAAAGVDRGGYATLREAVERMSELEDYGYDPIPENVKVYRELYKEYESLHDYFGSGGNDVMIRLKRMRQEIQP